MIKENFELIHHLYLIIINSSLCRQKWHTEHPLLAKALVGGAAHHQYKRTLFCKRSQFYFFNNNPTQQPLFPTNQHHEDHLHRHRRHPRLRLRCSSPYAHFRTSTPRRWLPLPPGHQRLHPHRPLGPLRRGLPLHDVGPIGRPPRRRNCR